MKKLILATVILSGCASFDPKNYADKDGNQASPQTASECEFEAMKYGQGQIDKQNIFNSCMKTRGLAQVRRRK